MSSIEQLLTKDTFDRLIDGTIGCVSFVQSESGSLESAEPQRDIVLFPGSFNPLHVGHQQMASIAAARLARPVWFELSVSNVEKDSLNYVEVLNRLKQFETKTYRSVGPSSASACVGILVSTAKKFVDKLDLFPESVFVVGADTIIRINDLKFYRDEKQREEAFARFTEPIGNGQNATKRFLVFGRWRDETFELDRVELHDDLKAQCEFVPQSEFENRISSTDIRQ